MRKDPFQGDLCHRITNDDTTYYKQDCHQAGQVLRARQGQCIEKADNLPPSTSKPIRIRSRSSRTSRRFSADVASARRSRLQRRGWRIWTPSPAAATGDVEGQDAKVAKAAAVFGRRSFQQGKQFSCTGCSKSKSASHQKCRMCGQPWVVSSAMIGPTKVLPPEAPCYCCR